MPTDNGASVKYRTIVADPPWDHHSGTSGLDYYERGVGWVDRKPTVYKLAYPTLSIGEIHALPVADLADPAGAHLFLWATSATLRDAFTVLDAWRFTYTCTLTWCKASNGIFGGTFRSNTEFILFARRGQAQTTGKAASRWFTWPKSGMRGRSGAMHSRKPEAFLDLVEEVCPGPYVELFARRQRLGWDTWGNEALEHVTLPQTEAAS